MITTFYGESGSPTGASDAAQRQFEEWQRDQDIEILQVATAACAVPSGLGFWLTIHWRWNEDPQRWSGGGDLAEALARHDQVAEGAGIDYDGSKRR